MATADIISKIDEAQAKAEVLTAKGAELLKEKVQQVSDAASQLATKVVHHRQRQVQAEVTGEGSRCPSRMNSLAALGS